MAISWATFSLVLCGMGLVDGLSCNPPYEPVGGQCLYVHYPYDYTWQEAREFCQTLSGIQAKGDLATFPTCDSFTALTKHLELNAPFTSRVWVGAHATFNPDIWLWVTGQPLQAGVPFWTYGNVYQEHEDCAAANGANYYRILSTYCVAPSGAVCSEAPLNLNEDHLVTSNTKLATFNTKLTTSNTKLISSNTTKITCPPGSAMIGDFCYVIRKDNQTWEEAKRRCEEEYSGEGGRLYYPSTCDEFTHLARYLKTLENQMHYWVGAIDTTGQNKWLWVDGGEVPWGTPYWAAGQPSHGGENNYPYQYCAVMDKGKLYYLNDVYCLESYGHICKLNAV